MVDNAVVEQHGPDIGALGLAVYNVLAMHGNRAYPGQQRIADLLGVSRKSVNEALQRLETAGLVVSEQRYRDDGGLSTKVYVLPPVTVGYNPPVTVGYNPCNPRLQHNNTQSNKTHTSYGEETSSSPDQGLVVVPDAGDKWFTPYVRDVRDHWQGLGSAGLRDRAVSITRYAAGLRTPNGKSVPAAVATALALVYRDAFGGRVPPDASRLMASARRKGGPERLAVIMVEIAGREVVGNPHDLIDRWGQGRRPEATPDTTIAATWGGGQD